MSDTASRDPNRNITIQGVSSADLSTPTNIAVNPSTKHIQIDAGSILVSSVGVGQAKIAVTGTAVQLGSNTLTNGVIISAKSGNAAPITIGGSGVTNTVDGTGNGYILAAGASVSFAVSNTNILYINGTSGDIVSFAGS